MLSPPAGEHWPPTRIADWAERGRRHRRGVDGLGPRLHWRRRPTSVAGAWATAPGCRRHAARSGRRRADVAGLRGAAHAARHRRRGVRRHGRRRRGHPVGGGSAVRGRGRELLARTGSLARVGRPGLARAPEGAHARRRHLAPLARSLRLRARRPVSTPCGTRCPAQRAGRRPRAASRPTSCCCRGRCGSAESDFRPLEGSVQRAEREPFGFFDFAPAERLDLDLVDRVADRRARRGRRRRHGGAPRERRARSTRIDDLEAVLARHGVGALIAGVRRQRPATRPPAGQLGAHRRAARWALVALPPEQAPPLVARREPDPPVPPRRRAAPGPALVGGDGGAPPVDPVPRARRRDHRRRRGLRGPGPPRRRRRPAAHSRADPGADRPARRARSWPRAGRLATPACSPTTPVRRC